MNPRIKQHPLIPPDATTAIECDFPILEISQLAERESWRKEINRPIYHIHKWWATRLGTVFRAITLAALSRPGTNIWNNFYESHQFTNKVVLDPFMGSGTTLGEAVKLGAKAIGCDINPISTFLVRQAFTRVPETELRAAFTRLEQKVAPDIRHYYQTRDPHTGELIPVLYFFWVKTVVTPTLETIPLFSRYVFSQNAYPKKKPKAQIICPNCWSVIENRYDTTNLICPHCQHSFNPQKGPASGQYITAQDGTRYRIKDLLPSNGNPPVNRLYAIMALRRNGEKVYLPVREEDLSLYTEAEARLKSETLPLPTLKIRDGYNTNQARSYNYTYWRDFFNSRQLLCLGLLLRSILEIEDQAIQEQMLCLFSSTLEFNSLFCSFKGEGTGAVRHTFSNHILKPERTPLENSVWGTDKSSGTFSSLFESRLMRAKRYLDYPFEIKRNFTVKQKASQKPVASQSINVQKVKTWEQFDNRENSLMVINGDSSYLPLPAKSVDAVVTDPPYFDFIHYSELSDFFFAWLSPVLKDRYPEFAKPNSSNQGEVQDKSPLIFARQLASVFSQCSRVLKDDGVLVFSFHHSKVEGWAAICEAITIAGMLVVATHPVYSEFRTGTSKTAAKSRICLDAILVCKKYSSFNIRLDQQTLISKTETLAKQLEEGGISISEADRFVILASQMLIPLSQQKRDFNFVCNTLQQIHQVAQKSWNSKVAS
ncbi:DNA methyltransferase [Okeania sp.]|uniref:DNA methyltransferase n=1 Tax=Okeania sp. TaxID=3100323 RepID=UPI002B4ABDE2|nr:DNA methyltransferase [Okeania sp.]MEB3342624.1 DNA methyltransferase [Okeania sp.]